jgi:hypothetical protein
LLLHIPIITNTADTKSTGHGPELVPSISHSQNPSP